MISIEKLGVAVSDFIGKHGLMWSDALCEAWEDAEASYVNEMTNAFNQGYTKEKNT
jgi:hypothetical protein